MLCLEWRKSDRLTPNSKVYESLQNVSDFSTPRLNTHIYLVPVQIVVLLVPNGYRPKLLRYSSTVVGL